MVAEASENWPGLEGEAAEELGDGGTLLPPPPPPPDAPALAVLLLELLEESCFFFEPLNFTLPESVIFNFSNNLLIGLSMMEPPLFSFSTNVLSYSVGPCTAERVNLQL